jgi:3'(2'), 5'-bisphosphate nucleotidase
MNPIFSVITQAGEIALAEQKNLKSQTKADGSIVTNGDLAVSHFLETELKRLYPEWEILSEENCKAIHHSEKVIILDPIDGTQSYFRGEDTWCVLIGFLDHLKPVQGYVYQPTTGNLYHAEKGQGAFLRKPDGTTIRLNADAPGPLKGIKSKKEFGETEFFHANHIHEIEAMYSAALKILKVAAGESDAYAGFQKACSIWDLAAPQCILEEAGGRIEYANPVEWDLNQPQVPERFCAIGKRIGQLLW